MNTSVSVCNWPSSLKVTSCETSTLPLSRTVSLLLLPESPQLCSVTVRRQLGIRQGARRHHGIGDLDVLVRMLLAEADGVDGRVLFDTHQLQPGIERLLANGASDWRRRGDAWVGTLRNSALMLSERRGEASR